MAEEKRVEELAALLSGSDRVGQVRAALDLVRLNNYAAHQVLCSALNNVSEHSRACAAMGVGKLRLMGAVPSLVRVLKGNAIGLFRDRSPEVRQTAAFALGEIGGPVAVKALHHAYEKDEQESVRTEAHQALTKLGALVRAS